MQHPSFPQPSNLNISLWRYMDIEKFKWLIQEKRLYMPTTEKLGDCLEGSIS